MIVPESIIDDLATDTLSSAFSRALLKFFTYESQIYAVVTVPAHVPYSTVVHCTVQFAYIHGLCMSTMLLKC